mgnify:CR=1 FL=1
MNLAGDEGLTSIGVGDISDLLMKVDSNIKLESVILSDENKEKVNQFLNEQINKSKLIRYGLEPINKLLFYGASGTGKTYLAKAITNYLKYTMLYVDIAKSLSDNSVATNMSRVFAYANEKGNCVIFLDECDSIAWSRDSTHSDSGVIRRATNSLFQQLDQMNKSNVFISATNMLHRLDPAFERRFNMKLEFRRPEMELIEVIKKFLYKDFVLVDDATNELKHIIQRNSRLSFYEIEDIVKRAMKEAILNDTLEVKTSNIFKEIAVSQRLKIRFKTDKDDPEIFESSIK